MNRRFWICLTALLLTASLFPRAGMAEQAVPDAALTQNVTEKQEKPKLLGYTEYIDACPAETGGETIVIPAESHVPGEGVTLVQGYEGYADEAGVPLAAVLTDAASTAVWNVQVPTGGLYRIRVQYYPVEGTSNAIERKLLLDGKVPFVEAESLRFERVWGNDGEPDVDENGNETRPSQIETPCWTEKYVQDADAFVSDDLCVYLTAGAHTLGFEALREPMAVGRIYLEPAAPIPGYEEARAGYTYTEYTGDGVVELVQGEDAHAKSDSTLYAIWDRSSPLTDPMDYSAIKLNSIGGEQWRMAGQWLEWKVTVPEDGLYRIALRARQNLTTGVHATRRLTIDGKLPFKEAAQVPVPYDSDWQSVVLGDKDGDWLFQLSKGTHTLRLQVALGDMGALAQKTDELLLRLNQAYREIIVITGTSPDTYRDYYLDKELPATIGELGALSKELYALSESLIKLTGKRSEQNSLLDRLALQTEQMSEKPERIAKVLATFKNNISSLGTWSLSIREQSLEIDTIAVLAKNATAPAGDAGFFAGLWHELRLFAAAFTSDYTSIGSDNTKDAVEVWVTSGREQAQIIKQMISREYTGRGQGNVNVKLVAASAVLPSILSKDCADVVIGNASTTIMDYAARGALLRLDDKLDVEALGDSFYGSALLPLRYEGGLYALPDSQVFPVVFYRTDIFEELGVAVPNTWTELYDVLYVLAQNQMEFGMTPALSSYAMFLYQQGGSFYKNGNKQSAMSETVNINAFRDYANLYINYSLPKAYNFANRFRSGEMPIGIADYSMYNQLVVFAPEIRGLWGFAPMIGTEKADGTIDRTVTGTVSGTVILADAKDPEACLRFLQWWTGCDAQVLYAREQESVMGAAARYTVANVQAMDRMAWDTDQLAVLKAQWSDVRGIPEVPGGYYTSRYVDFAYKAVVLQSENAREVLMDYTEIIDREIKNKRQEFDLPYEIEGEEDPS